MFVLKNDKDIELCDGCPDLKILPKTENAHELILCSKPDVKSQYSCQYVAEHTHLHQCDTCDLLGTKTDVKNITYKTCYSPKNKAFFGRWWKSTTQYAYFCPGGPCWYKGNKER